MAITDAQQAKQIMMQDGGVPQLVKKGKGKKTWFDFEFFKEILEYSVKKGTKAIKLNYINEPLIRNDLIKFIDFAKKIGVLDIYFSTNGLLLNEEISKKLISSGLTRIQI